MDTAKLPPPPKSGWPPGMLQDDSKKLSKWLASKPDARRRVREVAAEIERERAALAALSAGGQG